MEPADATMSKAGVRTTPTNEKRTGSKSAPASRAIRRPMMVAAELGEEQVGADRHRQDGRPTSSAIRAKSAARIDGAMRTIRERYPPKGRPDDDRVYVSPLPE